MLITSVKLYGPANANIRSSRTAGSRRAMTWRRAVSCTSMYHSVDYTVINRDRVDIFRSNLRGGSILRKASSPVKRPRTIPIVEPAISGERIRPNYVQ